VRWLQNPRLAEDRDRERDCRQLGDQLLGYRKCPLAPCPKGQPPKLGFRQLAGDDGYTVEMSDERFALGLDDQ
jgi:hypothetical protein